MNKSPAEKRRRSDRDSFGLQPSRKGESSASEATWEGRLGREVDRARCMLARRQRAEKATTREKDEWAQRGEDARAPLTAS